MTVGDIHWPPEALNAELARLGVAGRCTRPVSHLTVDSREVRPGSLFVAIRGERTDGHRYIEQAIGRGARVVLHEPGVAGNPPAVQAPAVDAQVDFVSASDTRRLSGSLAAWFYGFPARRLRVVGVTGTNGKTTCARVLAQLLERSGQQVGLIDSLGIHGRGQSRQLPNILPEPVTLQRELRRMVNQGAAAAVLEVSSYALSVGRVDDVDFDAAVLTNVTRDHLDVHRTLERYLAAKLHLFDLLAASGKWSPTASVWADSRFGAEIAAHLAKLTVAATRFAVGRGAAPGDGDGGDDVLRAENLSLGWSGTTFDLTWRGQRLPHLRTSLLGEFNLRNVLAALASSPGWLERLFSAGSSVQRLLAGLEDVQVPGRLELVDNDRDARILVDYAHTDDALRCVLETLSALPHRRLVVVFGCGGDRDREKRPLMGAVASRYADRVILTSDNPRTEDPLAIINEIAVGIPAGPGGYEAIEDRGVAIGVGLSDLDPGDILLVAGKGHEDHQIVGTESRPFDDRVIIREHL